MKKWEKKWESFNTITSFESLQMRSGENEKILVTGSLGQIGSELVMKLRDVYGASNVIATDIRETDSDVVKSGPFETLDVTDGQKLHDIAKRNEVDTIIHLAALLSATAEKIRYLRGI